jgi:hypothetical protein
MKRKKASHMDTRQLLFMRIEKDLETGDLKMAISRLEGALFGNPLDPDLNDKIADLYLKDGSAAKAGKHLYLKPDKSEMEIAAVQEFERRVGRDPTLMLKKLINKQFFRFTMLDDFQMEQLAYLIEETKKKRGLVPKFLRSLDDYIQRRNRTVITGS